MAGTTTDVVIVGGGIVGAATAYDLARRGVAVQLFESATLAGQQSGRNWGFVRQQGRSNKELPLMREANRRWQTLEAELEESVGWVQGGNLALAESATMADRYRDWVELGQSHGVDTRCVGPREVERIVPHLEVPFTLGMYAPSDGHADPRRATAAFAHAAERYGARIHCHAPVASLVRHNGRVTGVRTADAIVHAGTTICAAGAATRRLLRTVDVAVPQATVRSTVALTAPVPEVTKATVWNSTLSFRQRADGRLVVATGGGGEVDVTIDALAQARQFLPAFRRNHRRLRPRVGTRLVTEAPGPWRPKTPHVPVPRPNLGRVRRGMVRLAEALPSLSPVRLEHAWAGLIDSTPDMLPILDRPDSPDGLVVATGFSGHGFGLGPAVGSVVAALARQDHVSCDLDPFRLNRFAEGDFSPPDAVL